MKVCGARMKVCVGQGRECRKGYPFVIIRASAMSPQCRTTSDVLAKEPIKVDRRPGRSDRGIRPKTCNLRWTELTDSVDSVWSENASVWGQGESVWGKGESHLEERRRCPPWKPWLPFDQASCCPSFSTPSTSCPVRKRRPLLP